MIGFDEDQGPGRATIKVIGVGGGGGNAVNTMIEAGLEGVDFIVANTDCQVLETSQASSRIQLGKALTKGLGAGANPEIGRAAALEDAARVAEVLAGSDMVFVTAGMGGGTGTGAAPVIAQVARDIGALTVGVVTKPFLFEGAQRGKKARAGIAELAKGVDALIVIPNDRLMGLAGEDMPFRDAFAMADSVCLNAVRGISDLVTVPGIVNVDFADVRAVMTGMGRALMGTGRAAGKRGAVEAARQAINSPLLEDVSIDGATGVLINITGGPNLKLSEITEACALIQEAADPEANIIFGSVIDPHAGDEFRITVIATGFQTRAVDGVKDPGRGGGGGGVKRPTDQMALPMHPSALVAAAIAVMPLQPSMMSAPITVTAPRLPASAEPAAVPIDLDDLEPAVPASMPAAHTTPASPPPATVAPVAAVPMAYAPSAPTTASPVPVPATASPSGEISGPNDSRPIIRPAVGASAPPPGIPRRTTGPVPVMRAGEYGGEYGDEESEYDKPAYLRRGVIAPDNIER